MPANGNGYGAPPRGTQSTAGALGKGTVVSTAVSQSFNMITYALPMVFGWLSDTRTGRWNMICYGIAVIGIAHVLMCAAGAPSLLASGQAQIPYFLSLYILAAGSAMFKPNVSPLLLDQMKDTTLVTKTLKSGEKVIVDPEHTTERVMLWFYLLINIGGFMNVPTSYIEKYVGWYLAFLVPLVLYLPLPFVLWWLKPRLVLNPPGGSDLGNVCRVVGICFKRGGLKKMFSKKQSFFDAAKPSVIATSGHPITVSWNDAFVDDVRRAFQATGIFCFFPLQSINDNGLGGAANALTTMLTTNGKSSKLCCRITSLQWSGVPNDVINNFNSLSIIAFAPILNYGLYPLLRRYNIKFGNIRRITFGLILASVGGTAYTVLNYYAYKTGPCGSYGSSATCVDADGNSLVSSISIWYAGIPFAIGGISELFVNVPAYGMAYTMAPPNMRGLVSAINLLASAVSYAFGLAFAGLIRDPYITWDFGGPAIVGFVSAFVFWWIYHGLDDEEYHLSENDAIRNAEQEKFEREDRAMKAIEGGGSDDSITGVDEKHRVSTLPPYEKGSASNEKELGV